MSRDGSTLIISDRKHSMHIREKETAISYLPQPLIVAASHDFFFDDDMIAKQECWFVRIKPLPCGLAILPVYDNGSALSPELFDLTKDNLADKFADGVSMVASLSFTLSYPNLAAALHIFIIAYKNVLAVAVISVVSIESATVLVSKEERKKDEPVSESDDDLSFSLFD
ncbi:60S acidic ribosomal protein P0-like [Asparagus officinalis]|uniref:60S acidic ribosomal protein P0-like n=1 Tax=Asparagus officinalis TaxID=4686 RepID=UPI00098E1BB0|nr:60S acidic ribosomal protein P0-like [Asparagus officinalis]